jgi:hypothetical protein
VAAQEEEPDAEMVNRTNRFDDDFYGSRNSRFRSIRAEPEQMSEDELNACDGENWREEPRVIPILSQLEKLADLKDRGIINEQEFEAKKSQILKM